jgi:hypothetical protein
MILNSPHFRTTLTSAAPWSGLTRNATSRGIRSAVFALYEPSLEVPCRDVREPNVPVKRSEERYAGADQDGNSSNG